MSHIWVLDSEHAPDQLTLDGLAASGIGAFGGYAGGIARTNPSYNQGVSDGNDCLVSMQLRGLSGWIIADMENAGGAAYTWSKDEFGRVHTASLKINAFWVGPGGIAVDWFWGFVEACHAGLCSVQLYGTPSYINALGGIADSWYLAFWPAPNQTESFPKPDWDQWQYSTGPTYDYSVAVDTWPFTGFTP